MNGICIPLNGGEERFTALFERIDALLKEKPFVRVAIDGPCASGKSTLGELLHQRYDATLFHMDDYYVPFAGKTPERLAIPGGNADFERFSEEVTSHAPGEVIPFRRFDCVTQTLEPVQMIEPRPLTVVEGSYSLLPQLRRAYDLTVWIEADMETRMARILKRNGPEKLEMFKKMWIPLEDRYFEAYQVRESCDIVYRAED